MPHRESQLMSPKLKSPSRSKLLAMYQMTVNKNSVGYCSEELGWIII